MSLLYHRIHRMVSEMEIFDERPHYYCRKQCRASVDDLVVIGCSTFENSLSIIRGQGGKAIRKVLKECIFI